MSSIPQSNINPTTPIKQDQTVPASALTPATSSSTTTSTTTNANFSPSPETSSPPPAELPTLEIEFPADHPVARRLAAQQQAAALGQRQGDTIHLTPTKPEDSYAAFLLQRNSLPLSIPNSPAEQARRMSITPESRRNSILAIPPVQSTAPVILDHLPVPGSDADVDLAEIEREIEEIDTIG